MPRSQAQSRRAGFPWQAPGRDVRVGSKVSPPCFHSRSCRSGGSWDAFCPHLGGRRPAFFARLVSVGPSKLQLAVKAPKSESVLTSNKDIHLGFTKAVRISSLRKL